MSRNVADVHFGVVCFIRKRKEENIEHIMYVN